MFFGIFELAKTIDFIENLEALKKIKKQKFMLYKTK